MQLQMYKRRMIKNKLKKGVVKLKYVPTEEHVANVLTKPLSRVKLKTPSRQAWCSLKISLWKEGVIAEDL